MSSIVGPVKIVEVITTPYGTGSGGSGGGTVDPTIYTRLTALEQDVASIKSSIGTIQAAITALQQTVGAQTSSIATIQANMLTSTSLNAINATLGALDTRIAALEAGGGGTPNSAPTDIAWSPTSPSIPENAAAGTVVATLSATDPDSGDTLTYSLTGGDTAKYEIVGNQVRVKAGATFSAASDPSDTLQVRVADQDGASRTETMTIAITAVSGGSKDIILDDDGETDSDGITNLEYGIALHKAGTVTIRGVICCSKFNRSPVTMRLFLDSRGLTNVPVGWTPRSGSSNPDFYNADTATKFGKSGETGDSDTTKYVPAARLYRQLVKAYPGIRIATGGFAKPLVEFMNSAGDDIDARTGMQLIQDNQPKLFAGFGRRPVGHMGSTQTGGWTNSSAENNAGFDPANTSSLFANWPIPMVFYAFPEDFTTHHPQIHIKAGGDPDIDPITYAWSRCASTRTLTGDFGPVTLNDSNGERAAGDIPLIQAAVDDILGTQTANYAYSNTGTHTINASNGQSTFTPGAAPNRHRYLTPTKTKSQLETLWQGVIDSDVFPVSVTLVKDWTSHAGGVSDNGATQTANNVKAPDGTTTADTVTGSGWGGWRTIYAVTPGKTYTYAEFIGKTSGRTRFPVIGLQVQNPSLGQPVVAEGGFVLNTNNGAMYAASGAAAPGFGSMALTNPTCVSGETVKLPSWLDADADDFWHCRATFTVPAGCTQLWVYEQTAAGSTGTDASRTGTGPSTSQVFWGMQLEPRNQFSGVLPTDGDCTWAQAA